MRICHSTALRVMIPNSSRPLATAIRPSDRSDGDHVPQTTRRRFAARLNDQQGFTLIELLVVIAIIGILAAIALAVFGRQADKGKDAGAKSAVNNLVRLVQECDASQDTGNDFRQCDSAVRTLNGDPTSPRSLGTTGLDIAQERPTEAATNNCPSFNQVSALTVVFTNGDVRVVNARPGCFTVMGVSDSGNRFWYQRQTTGVITRDCTTRGVNGCPSNGQWAG
jgi:prepilin-type N-terminal cleavage/methylation domain-containing protein